MINLISLLLKFNINNVGHITQQRLCGSVRLRLTTPKLGGGEAGGHIVPPPNFAKSRTLCEITPFGRVFHIMWRGYLRCSTISRPPVVTSHNSGYPKFLYANPTGFAPRNSGLSAPHYTQFKKYFSFNKEF